jgi:hypothetical protein
MQIARASTSVTPAHPVTGLKNGHVDETAMSGGPDSPGDTLEIAAYGGPLGQA